MHMQLLNLFLNCFFSPFQSDLNDPIEGDPKYLAPELLQGIFTKAADIFRYLFNR